MKKQLTFQTAKNFSVCIEDNELFSQYSMPDFPHYYDLNFIQLHFNPTSEEFELLENILMADQVAEMPNHLKFYWPENTGLYVEVLEYLSQEGYELGKLELMHLLPNEFKQSSSNPNVLIQPVTSATLEAFIAVNFQADLSHGEAFSENKRDFYRKQFSMPDVSFWVAFIEDEPVGSLILVESEHYLEVDNLLTADAWRKQGVASEILARVVELADSQQKSVILLADAEDSPREMYLKQGFERISSQIHVLKEFKK